MREKGIFRIVVIALLLPLLLGVATADAKKKKKKPKSPPVTLVSATKTTSADGELATVTATCPAGKIAVGGGFTSPLLFSGTTLTDLYIVYESRRSGDNSWVVSGGREHSGGPAPPVPLTATVDCRSTTLSTKKSKKASASKKKKRKVLRVSEVSATGSAAVTGAESTATAACPPGTQAIGGGYSSSPAPHLTGSNTFPVFFESYRSSPASWLSSFLESGSAPRTVTSYAYCAAGLKLSQTNASFTIPASSMAGIESKTLPTPRCPKGLALLGGGFSSTMPASMGPLPIWTRSGAAGAIWEVGMFNLSLAADALNSFGYCA